MRWARLCSNIKSLGVWEVPEGCLADGQQESWLAETGQKQDASIPRNTHYKEREEPWDGVQAPPPRALDHQVPKANRQPRFQDTENDTFSPPQLPWQQPTRSQPEGNYKPQHRQWHWKHFAAVHWAQGLGLHKNATTIIIGLRRYFQTGLTIVPCVSWRARVHKCN